MATKAITSQRFGIYLVLIVFQYAMLRLFAERQGWQPWLAFFTPIAALIVVRYIPGSLLYRAGPPLPRELARRARHGRHFLSGLSHQPARAGSPQRRGQKARILGIPELLLFPAHHARRPHQHLRQLSGAASKARHSTSRSAAAPCASSSASSNIEFLGSSLQPADLFGFVAGRPSSPLDRSAGGHALLSTSIFTAISPAFATWPSAPPA